MALVKLAFKTTPLSVHENDVMVAGPPTMVLEAVVVPEACKENRAVPASINMDTRENFYTSESHMTNNQTLEFTHKQDCGLRESASVVALLTATVHAL